MDRRKFLSIGIPATGAIMIAPGCFNGTIAREISRQFSGKRVFGEYDIVINGAGLSGYFAAINAAKEGKRVLLVEKRTSPGYEITAKKRLWILSEGYSRFNKELIQLFLPEGEHKEVHNTFGKGRNNSFFNDEILLFSGSIRKGMLRNLLKNKIHVLLMTDVCGLLTDNINVKGVLLASKHGIHSVRCRSFVDASDNLMFSRYLAGGNVKAESAGFVSEIRSVKDPNLKEVLVDEAFGLINNSINFHRGKNTDDQLLMEFYFPLNQTDNDLIEQKSRLILEKIGNGLPGLDKSLENARISEFALECSVLMVDKTLPDTILKGHYLLPNLPAELSCNKILDIEAYAARLVNDIIYPADTAKDITGILIPGNEIPVNELAFSDVDEPGFSVPLKNCIFDIEKYAGVRDHYQVLIAGGGTSGAMAGRGSVEKGAYTIIVDYFNDLGGTRTMGGVMSYYHGVRDPEIFKKQDIESRMIATENNMSFKSGHKLYHLHGILNTGGKFLPGTIICGSLVRMNSVQGVVICRDGMLETIKGEITIDATGDGDIAYFSGAGFSHGNSRTGKTQNYSQWDIPGGGKLPTAISRDYDIIDNTKIAELQRGLFLSHYMAHFYDFHPMLTVRESRRIEGLYKPDLIDAVEGTHFEDVISFASSDFDPHYIGNSEYTRCGFLLPHSNILTVEIPYRAIVPQNIGGLLVSGKGFSQTHNYMQFTRMCPDLLVLGYLTGQIAAELAQKNIQPADYDITGLQKEWAAGGNLPADYATRRTGNLNNDNDEIRRRIFSLAKGRDEYLWECCRLPKERAVPLLLNSFEESASAEGSMLLAKALAWFGNSTGNDLVENELNMMFIREQNEGYPEGYIEKYDYIRGREKNVLEGVFWKINQNIALLAMAGNPRSNNSIRFILENTSSGGEMVKWHTGHMESRVVNDVYTIDYINENRADYFNNRIDLRLIPFHNRIYNLCFYAERVADNLFINGFEKLLNDPNIGGFITREYDRTRLRVYGGDLELYIAAASARCGSARGYNLLTEYLSDIHYNFKNYAATELRELTRKDFGYDVEAWKNYTGMLTYPQPALNKLKETEL